MENSKTAENLIQRPGGPLADLAVYRGVTPAGSGRPVFELFQTGNETNVVEYVCIGTLFVCVCTYVLLRARALACYAGTLGCLGHEGGARVG